VSARLGEARAGDLATKNRELVAQHKTLGVFGQLVHPVYAEHLQGASGQAVQEGEGHES
jgi:hypothetical protein